MRMDGSILRTFTSGLALELPRFTKCILLPKVASARSQRQRNSGALGRAQVAVFRVSTIWTGPPARLQPAHLAPRTRRIRAPWRRA